MSSHNAMYVTDVKALTMFLHGVIEVSWKPPIHPDFKEVAVFRKTNDFVTNELDPYATLIYKGTATKIYDYSVSQGASADLADTTKKIIGTYDSNSNQFLDTVSDSLRGDTLYYYTVFAITQDNEYHHSYATQATSWANSDKGMSDIMYSYLSGHTKMEDKNFQLQRYLRGIGMAYDYLKTLADNMTNLINIDTCEPYQLEYIAYLLDWDLDKTLSIPSQRQSLKTAIEVYRNTGTKKGLDMLVKNNSGFPNTSGVEEGRDYNTMSTYFGYFPFDLVRYDYAATPNFDTLDPLSIGKAGDPLKYTFDFSPNAKQESQNFIAYVRKTTVITPEQETILRERLQKLLTRFAPFGTRFEIEIY